ncbi:MAG: inositol-3-phosphate synthase [Planctomycetota bacterium]
MAALAYQLNYPRFRTVLPPATHGLNLSPDDSTDLTKAHSPTSAASAEPSSLGSMPRTGVWLVGAKGGVATTVIVGSLAVCAGLARPIGMLTAAEECRGLPLTALDALVFGGHDIRTMTVRESAEQLYREIGTLRREWLDALDAQLRALETNFRPGVLYHSGRAIEALSTSLSEPTGAGSPPRARAVVDRIASDLREFAQTHQLERVVVVNLASTEPPVDHSPLQNSAAGIEKLLESPPRTGAPATSYLRASSLYAIAAARCGCPYLNFTPSPAALLPGIAEMFTAARLPFMGSDGKTGETLVKSTLAPMFRMRQLRVLSWQGYNILGDRDGLVLADAENKKSKTDTKDKLLHEQLGYPLHTHVGIDYVPSLNDWKTAWDHIHFEGFLGNRMVMQFVWQGCDSVLAAPLVLDLVRFLALAHARGESGPQPHLSAYFKSPFAMREHDLTKQFAKLEEYIELVRASLPR